MMRSGARHGGDEAARGEVVTDLLERVESGDREAWSTLFEHVHGELKQIARGHLRRQQGGTLHTTELVHDAYLKLFGNRKMKVENRAHFFALAARAMRQVLVDHFRRRRAQKRGGTAVTLDVDALMGTDGSRQETILAVDEALRRLSELDPRLGRVVECRFFGGMTQVEIGRALGISERTVRSDWRSAKAWLARELGA
jgi:RNA polymerase sigma factor (TIGR02999 family)